MNDSNKKDDKQWQEKLTPQQYQVCRNKGTEPAFTGEYNSEKGVGEYLCACCETKLFDSETKYDSGSGWPSFYAAADNSCVDEETDITMGMERTEIMCSQCGSHLGHVFPDGPQPTGLRYCVNSLSLKFEEQK